MNEQEMDPGLFEPGREEENEEWWLVVMVWDAEELGGECLVSHGWTDV
jgi:hypothetical protein